MQGLSGLHQSGNRGMGNNPQVSMDLEGGGADVWELDVTI